MRFRTTYTFDRFVDLPRERSLKVLDFGFGEGHSTDPLLELFPNARFVCADIPGPLSSTGIARFKDNPRVQLIEMGGPLTIASVGRDFDIIQMNAVFEHLLPDERKRLMPDLWDRLRVGGYLVVTETPWRWFPVETHTTSLPFVNYMPDRAALAAARYCGRYSKSLTWEQALRGGLRGATVSEIVSSLGAQGAGIQVIQSFRTDARDLLEVWWQGESRKTRQKALAYRTLRLLQRLTGVVISPWINLVIRKLG